MAHSVATCSTSGSMVVHLHPRARWTVQPAARRQIGVTKRNVVRAASGQQADEAEVPDVTYNFIAQSQSFFRALPLYAGGGGIVFLLANRFLSGIAPVVDASSSQSRTDVLGIAMSAVLLLTGLQWLSLKPRVMPAVPLDGEDIYWSDPLTKLPPAVASELKWAWDALRTCTRCRSLVLMYQGRTIFHAGAIKAGVVPGAAKAGDICNSVMTSGTGNYLANLVLYPGRLEFTSYLPENTQGVVIHAVGKQGVLIAGTDTVRGFGRLDQAWVATIADKLEVSLDGVKVAQPGAGFGAKAGKQ